MGTDSTICCSLSPNKQLYSPHGLRRGWEGWDGEWDTSTVEGQSSRDGTDLEVGISSIREALSYQDAGFDVCLRVCVCGYTCVFVTTEVLNIKARLLPLFVAVYTDGAGENKSLAYAFLLLSDLTHRYAFIIITLSGNYSHLCFIVQINPWNMNISVSFKSTRYWCSCFWSVACLRF